MASIPFSLRPFEATANTAGISVVGTITRTQNTLSLSYLLKGNLSSVSIPPLSDEPVRKDRLWEQTCFEFFLAEGAEHDRKAPYWEFNLSPTGNWNVFALESYRQGLREENAFAAMPFSVRSSDEGVHLDISVDVSSLVEAGRPLRLGVSMVIVVGDEESFWAIAHPDTTADFHHPDSFTALVNPSL